MTTENAIARGRTDMATMRAPVGPEQLPSFETLVSTLGLSETNAPQGYHGPFRSIRPIHRSSGGPDRAGRTGELQAQVEGLLARVNLAVIYGGDKAEDGAVLFPTHNPRSWKSYRAVAEDLAASLERLGARNVAVMADDMRLQGRLQREAIDFAWLNTGGVQGMGAVCHASAQLEMLGVPYVGHDPLTAAILDSKHTFKRQIDAMGIPTAPFMTWHGATGTFDPATDPRFARAFGRWEGEFVVKPVSGRASLHVEHVARVEDLSAVAAEVFAATQNHVMIEGYLSGREYCIAACGNVVAAGGTLERREGPFTFCAIERVLEADERIFTSMDKKAITKARIRHLDPVADRSVATALHRLGRRVFEEMELETLVRLDVRADANGNLHVLEANPKPDLKAPTADGVTSIVAEALEHRGMAYDDLILSLFADRVDGLFKRRRGSVNHLVSLLTHAET